MVEFDIRNLGYIKKFYEHRLSKVLKEDLNVGFAIFAEILYTKTIKTQQELSDYALCNKAHTSRTLLKMQLKGLVKAINTNKNSQISLTKKGEEFAEICIQTREELQQKLVENINKKDLETFSRVLTQILANTEVVASEIKE